MSASKKPPRNNTSDELERSHDSAELRQLLTYFDSPCRKDRGTFWRWSFAEERLTNWSDEYQVIDVVSPDGQTSDEAILESTHDENRDRVAQIYELAFDTLSAHGVVLPDDRSRWWRAMAPRERRLKRKPGHHGP